MKLDVPPSPDTMRKLVAKETNGVTYEDLMIASGYISAPAIEQLSFDLHDGAIAREGISIVVPRSACDESDPQLELSERENRWHMERIKEREERKRFSSIGISIVMSNLSGCPFPWRIENSPSNQGIVQQSDLTINFADAPVETWEFDFRFFRSSFDDNDERSLRVSPGFALNTWGRLATRDIPDNYKYTLVTSSKAFYNSHVRRFPKNLDINISLMLLNIENFQILKEEYVAYHHDANIGWLEKLMLADKGEY